MNYDRKVMLCGAAILFVSLVVGVLIASAPVQRKQPPSEFMAVGRVFDYKDVGEGAGKLSFEHPDGTVERMVFCKSGTLEILDGAKYSITWAIWYTGTPGEGCYTLTKVQRVYEMEDEGSTED